MRCGDGSAEGGGLIRGEGLIVSYSFVQTEDAGPSLRRVAEDLAEKYLHYCTVCVCTLRIEMNREYSNPLQKEKRSSPKILLEVRPCDDARLTFDRTVSNTTTRSRITSH